MSETLEAVLYGEVAVREMVQALAKQHGGVRGLAKHLRITPSYVSDVCNGRRAPGPPFLRALKLKKIVGYVTDASRRDT